jgi:hypothetical protein
MTHTLTIATSLNVIKSRQITVVRGRTTSKPDAGFEILFNHLERGGAFFQKVVYQVLIKKERNMSSSRGRVTYLLNNILSVNSYIKI